MVNEDVEGSGTDGDPEGSCWTPDCHRGSRRDLCQPEVAMHVTCGSAAPVLEVGEEEPDSVVCACKMSATSYRGRHSSLPRGRDSRKDPARVESMPARRPRWPAWGSPSVQSR
jgi:hypothetical protein